MQHLTLLFPASQHPILIQAALKAKGFSSLSLTVCVLEIQKIGLESRAQSWSPRWPHYQHLFRLSLQITQCVRQVQEKHHPADTAGNPTILATREERGWCFLIHDLTENRQHRIRIRTDSGKIQRSVSRLNGDNVRNAKVTRRLNSLNGFDLQVLKFMQRVGSSSLIRWPRKCLLGRI